MRKVLVTGAGGFIGSRLVERMLRDPRFDDARITLLDRALPRHSDKRIRRIEGDLVEAPVRAEALDGKVDMLFHLAGVLGGAAEADYAAARRVNVDATLSLFEEVSNPAAPPRVVFASSIAVFGQPLPGLIEDSSWPRPMMHYGAQKLMLEIALDQFSRRGLVDGLAIRLPGIVARRNADARQKAAFLNLIFHAVAEGRDFTLPVPPEGTTWLLSVPACIDAFLHAGLVQSPSAEMARAFTLPAQCVRIDSLVAALRRRFPHSPSRIDYAPQPELTAQFGAQPPLTTATGDLLGFRHDGDLETLIKRALEDD